MYKSQCVSVTDLRTRTKQCLENLEQNPKYIFINNKPVAVLVGIDTYEEEFLKPELIELPCDEVSPSLARAINRAKKKHIGEFINI